MTHYVVIRLRNDGSGKPGRIRRGSVDLMRVDRPVPNWYAVALRANVRDCLPSVCFVDTWTRPLLGPNSTLECWLAPKRDGVLA